MPEGFGAYGPILIGALVVGIIGLVAAVYESRHRKGKDVTGRDELLATLRELTDISGEASITLDSAKAVRKMGMFIAARERAQKLIARLDSSLDIEPSGGH